MDQYFFPLDVRACINAIYSVYIYSHIVAICYYLLDISHYIAYYIQCVHILGKKISPLADLWILAL